jgi:hypothetical protein
MLASTETAQERTATIDNNAGEDDVLATLFGSPKSRDGFFANDFGKNVVHFQRKAASSNKTDTILRDLNLPCIVDGRLDMRILFDTTNYVALRKRGSLNYLDKAHQSYDYFCDYISDGGSAVIPVAEENALVPLMASIEASLRQREQASANNCTVGINVYHSGPNAVALNRHCDQYDVLVLHLDGKKDWEIGVFKEGYQPDPRDPKALDYVSGWKNLTLMEGELLYIPKGVFHAATTNEGYASTTHATIALEY